MSAPLNPSGAAALGEEVQTVLNYLRSAFSRDEIDHIPKPDQYADLFRVRQGNDVLHSLLVSRRFYDDHKDDLAATLAEKNVCTLLKKAGTRLVELP